MRPTTALRRLILIKTRALRINRPPAQLADDKILPTVLRTVRVDRPLAAAAVALDDVHAAAASAGSFACSFTR